MPGVPLCAGAAAARRPSLTAEAVRAGSRWRRAGHLGTDSIGAGNQLPVFLLPLLDSRDGLRASRGDADRQSVAGPSPRVCCPRGEGRGPGLGCTASWRLPLEISRVTNSRLFLFCKTGIRLIAVCRVRHGVRADAGGTDTGTRRPWIQSGGVQGGSAGRADVSVTLILFYRLQKILTLSTGSQTALR